MKMPINCPICKEPLCNSFLGSEKSNCLQKECTNKLDHKIYYISLMDSYDELSLVSIPLTHGVIVIWSPLIKDLEIRNTSKTEGQHLPYFEPDFSDYKHLIKKLKTYITFS
jgi:hypothetical protein